MKRVLVAGAVCVMVLAATAWSDILYLTDGSKREGKIIESTEAEVVLEMTMGGMKAVVRVGRAQIVRIEKSQTKQELLEEELARRKAALKAGDLDGMEELAKWCAAGALYDQATQLYQQMAATGQAGLKRGKMGLSKMEFGRGRLTAAITAAEELRKSLPEDKEVQGWVEQLRKAREAETVESVKNALAQNEAGRPDLALRVLQGLLDRIGLEETRTAFAGSAQVLAGNPQLLDYMATLRLARKCPYCQEGRLACKDCKGSGKTERGWLCPTCKGAGTAGCSRCDGTGIYWDSVRVEERPAVLTLLAKMADEEDVALAALKTKMAGDQATTAELAKAWGEVRDRGRRSQTLRDWALTLNPEAETRRALITKERNAEQLSADILVAAGGKLATAGNTMLKEVNDAGAGLLRSDQKLREAHELLQRAEACYGMVDVKTVKVSEDPRQAAKTIHETVAQMEQVLDRNAAMTRIYNAAIEAAKAERTADALKLL